MRKPLHHRRRGQHVLLALRKIIGASACESKEVIGLAPDTIKSITSGRLAFGPRAAAKVADATGVSLAWLLAGDASKPPRTAGGKEFTAETFQRHEFARDKVTRATLAARKRGDDAFRLWLLLCVKCGQLMLAAAEGNKKQPSGDAAFAAWACRDAIVRLGKAYPTFEKGLPEAFSRELQVAMHGKLKVSEFWAMLLDYMHRGVATIEGSQAAKAVTSGKPNR